MPESGSAYEIRTRVPALRGLCPGPLDECAADVCIPAVPSMERNPGSSPNGSNSLEENALSKRALRMRTPLSVRTVLLNGFKRDYLKALFFHRVDKRSEDECWPWAGYIGPWGYGVFGIARKQMPATHVAWFLETGELPPAGFLLMHSCDNPPCVNVRHLKVGTDADNHADRDAKGRLPRGDRRWNAKLTEANVREARTLRAAGLTYRELAARYGVDKKAIERAVKGQTWDHVPMAVLS